MLKICGGCGSAYAPDLEKCPHCSRTDYTWNYEQEPEAVPGPPAAEPATTQDQASTQQPSSPESSAPADGGLQLPPVRAPKADWVDHAVEAVGLPREDAEAMTKPELVETVKSADEGGAA